MRTIALETGCAPAARSPTDSPRPVRGPLRLAPADRGGHLLDVADEVGVERLAARAQLLARGAEVLPAHLERVEPGPARELVDLELADPLQVRRAEGAVGARGRGVRVDAGGVDAIRPPSGTARARRRRPWRSRGGRCPHRRRCRTSSRPRGRAGGRRASAAVRIRQRMPWRRVVTIDSSTRFWIRTGRPALRARATVIGSIFVYDFEPKPPPR